MEFVIGPNTLRNIIEAVTNNNTEQAFLFNTQAGSVKNGKFQGGVVGVAGDEDGTVAIWFADKLQKTVYQGLNADPQVLVGALSNGLDLFQEGKEVVFGFGDLLLKVETY